MCILADTDSLRGQGGTHGLYRDIINSNDVTFLATSVTVLYRCTNITSYMGKEWRLRTALPVSAFESAAKFTARV